MQPTTMVQIAREAGVSHPVVSKVLHGGKNNIGVSVATQARILRVAERLGYRANTAAMAMRSGRFDCASLVLSADLVRSLTPMKLLDGIHDTLAEHGMHLNVSKLPDTQLVNEGFIPKILRECLADGLLINYNALIPSPMIELIQRYRIPAIWINSKQAADCVYTDDRAAGCLAAERLIQLGHQHIAFANYSGNFHYSAHDRREGYEAAMQHAGLEPRVIEASGLEQKHYANYAAQWMMDSPEVTAVIGYDYFSTLATFRAAVDLLHRTVPGDLSIVGFHEQPIHYWDSELTTLVVREKCMGETAVRLLIRKIESPDTRLDPEILPIIWVEGKSTSAPVDQTVSTGSEKYL